MAEEKGYFRAEGLDYEFRELIRSTGGQHHDKGGKVGAFQSIEKGREAERELRLPLDRERGGLARPRQALCRCLFGGAGGIFVPADSPIRTPEDLAGVPISVGFQSGSHYSTIQALEQYLPRRPDQPVVRGRHAVPPHGAADRRQGAGRRAVQRPVLLRRAARLPQGDRHHLHDRRHDQRRSRSGGCAPLLPRAETAQRDIDLRPELYTHYYKNEFPERFHAVMDTRRWGPGERIVFEPYTRQVYEQSFDWIARHEIFAEGRMGSGDYDKATVSFAG